MGTATFGQGVQHRLPASEADGINGGAGTGRPEAFCACGHPGGRWEAPRQNFDNPQDVQQVGGNIAFKPWASPEAWPK